VRGAAVGAGAGGVSVPGAWNSARHHQRVPCSRSLRSWRQPRRSRQHAALSEEFHTLCLLQHAPGTTVTVHSGASRGVCDCCLETVDKICHAHTQQSQLVSAQGPDDSPLSPLPPADEGR
jgi:hypothetical protein